MTTIDALRAEREALYARHDQLFRTEDENDAKLTRWTVAAIVGIVASFAAAVLIHNFWFAVGAIIIGVVFYVASEWDSRRWQRIDRDEITPGLARVAEINKELAKLRACGGETT